MQVRFLPLIELRRIDPVLLADLRNGAAFPQMLAQNFDFFLRGVMPPTIRVFVVPALFRLWKSSLIHPLQSVIPSEAQHGLVGWPTGQTPQRI
jgi:hypothetical protein